MTPIKSTVIIPAAGKGKRMNHQCSKQYIMLKDKPILVHTLEAFIRSDMIRDIIIVVGKGEIDYCRKEIVESYKLNKVYKIIEGGKERQDSVYEGIKAIAEDTDIILIHDAARPFIEERHIAATIKEAWQNGACALGVPVKDTIKVVNQDSMVIDTPKRSTLWAIQTPQTFQASIIKEAYKKAMTEGYVGTDDAMIVEQYSDRAIKILEGSYGNIKITTREDLIIANSLDIYSSTE